MPFNKALIKSKIFQEVEEPFTFDRTVYPTQPQGNIQYLVILFKMISFFLKGDTIQVAKDIHKKWSKRIHSRLSRSAEDYWESSEENSTAFSWYQYFKKYLMPTVIVMN